ncbi:hypothetical protein EVAR_6069_1 [Eumeta japonica]|uniref:Uncharacterized protein n=1 Tax=Eumeta variegata TaxID=151549 RepID=A0A4C1TGN7_EUMVA|nr:hypothetical protein EVAR_6069_1 [Eumeta japonica]
MWRDRSSFPISDYLLLNANELENSRRVKKTSPEGTVTGVGERSRERIVGTQNGGRAGSAGRAQAALAAEGPQKFPAIVSESVAFVGTPTLVAGLFHGGHIL